MSGKALLVLTENELREALRNRWFLAYAIAFTVLSGALSLLVYSTGSASPVSGFGRTAASLINLMLLLVPLMGVTLGALAFATERERGALDFWLAQPIGPGTFFLAKAFGLGLALAGAVVVGFGISAAFLLSVGATDPLAYFVLTVLTLLLAWASLAIGLLLSSRCARTATAVALALGTWLVMVFIGDLGLLGTALAVRLSPAVLLALALVNPAEVYRIAALRTLAGSLEVLGPAGLYADERFGAILPVMLAAFLVVWTIAVGIAAAGILRREVLR